MNETIIKMWNEGKSGLEIGEFLGVTRNVVIGRITRLREKGVVLRQSDKSADAKKAIKQRRARYEERTSNGWVTKSKPIDTGPITNGTTIMALAPDSCRFVIGTDEDATAVFCAATIQDRSYCTDHYSLCYRPFISRQTR